MNEIDGKSIYTILIDLLSELLYQELFIDVEVEDS